VKPYILRVILGGGWSNAPSWLRSAHRDKSAPSQRLAHRGLRPVLDAPKEKK